MHLVKSQTEPKKKNWKIPSVLRYLVPHVVIIILFFEEILRKFIFSHIHTRAREHTCTHTHTHAHTGSFWFFLEKLKHTITPQCPWKCAFLSDIKTWGTLPPGTRLPLFFKGCRERSGCIYVTLSIQAFSKFCCLAHPCLYVFVNFIRRINSLKWNWWVNFIWE